MPPPLGHTCQGRGQPRSHAARYAVSEVPQVSAVAGDTRERPRQGSRGGSRSLPPGSRGDTNVGFCFSTGTAGGTVCGENRKHPAGLGEKPARPWAHWKPDVFLPQALHSAGFLTPSFKSQSRRIEIKAFLPRKSTSNTLRNKAGDSMDTGRQSHACPNACARGQAGAAQKRLFHGAYFFPSL